MSKAIVKIPARGQAWIGDWEKRILDRLHKRGFGTIASFADARPVASLVELANELSIDEDANTDRSDIAAEQIARLWRREANRHGTEAVEHMARRILVGELRRGLPEGWLPNWTESEEARSAASRAASATTSWASALGQEYEEASDRVFTALVEEAQAGSIPRGWLPASADDPILLRIFQQHWKGNS